MYTSDSQLVEAAQNGDLEGFGKLYERYYASIVWLAYAVLSDRHLAEDCAQEAFALACEKVSSLRQPQKFPSWVAGICRNVAHQWLKRKKKENLVDELPEISEQNNNDTIEVEKVIRSAVNELPEKYREPLILYYWNYMSYEEIGTILGICGSVVKGRLFRAKRKLGKYLKIRSFVRILNYETD